MVFDRSERGGPGTRGPPWGTRSPAPTPGRGALGARNGTHIGASRGGWYPLPDEVVGVHHRDKLPGLRAACSLALLVALGCSPSEETGSPPETGETCARAGLQVGAPWPMRDYCLQRWACAPQRGPEAPAVTWSHLTGGYVYSSPAIGSDGTVYVGSHGHVLRPGARRECALDLRDRQAHAVVALHRARRHRLRGLARPQPVRGGPRRLPGVGLRDRRAGDLVCGHRQRRDDPRGLARRTALRAVARRGAVVVLRDRGRRVVITRHRLGGHGLRSSLG